MTTLNPYEPGTQTAESLVRPVTESPSHPMSLDAQGIFNLLCKMVGLYWLSYGMLTSTETVYTLLTAVITNIPPQYANDQSVSLLWGFQMLTLGAILMLMSRRITGFAFMFDGPSEDTLN